MLTEGYFNYAFAVWDRTVVMHPLYIKVEEHQDKTERGDDSEKSRSHNQFCQWAVHLENGRELPMNESWNFLLRHSSCNNICLNLNKTFVK